MAFFISQALTDPPGIYETNKAWVFYFKDIGLSGTYGGLMGFWAPISIIGAGSQPDMVKYRWNGTSQGFAVEQVNLAKVTL